jgi:hypothetical protein
MSRPDLTVTLGTTAAVVSGNCASEAVEAIGAVRTATWTGYEIPLVDVSALRHVAAARGWSLTERMRAERGST